MRAAVALGLIGLVLGGCGRETRYEVLTFFFTGVPPLEEWGKPAKPETAVEPRLSRAANVRQKLEERKRRDLLIQVARLGWTHGPYGARQCSRCHALQGSLSFVSGAKRGTATVPTSAAATGRLHVPVTELCLGCHTGKSREAAAEKNLWLHAPVAAGRCVECHSPHQSRRRFMLYETDNVALCTRCHDGAGLRQRTPVHTREPETDCVECHNPHMGRTAMNLKSDYDEWDAY